MTKDTENETPEATETETGGRPKPKRWNVDVMETSRRVVVVESFTRSEARHVAKNPDLWVEIGEPIEVVKSKPQGAPRELDADGNEVPEKPKADK